MLKTGVWVEHMQLSTKHHQGQKVKVT